MLPIEIPSIKYKTEIATSWEELSPIQFVRLSGLIRSLSEKKISINEFEIATVCVLMDIEGSTEKLSTTEKEQITGNLKLIAKEITFILTPENNNGEKELNYSFIENLMPSFTYDGKVFYGPGPAMNNCTFEEFILAHSYYTKFFETGDDSNIVRLLTILWREQRKDYYAVLNSEDFDGQVREKFNQHRFNDRFKLFYKKNKPHATIEFNGDTLITITENIAYAAWIYFESVMQSIVNHPRYSLLWKDKEGEEAKHNLGLIAVVYDFEERGLTSNLDYLYNVLDILYLDKLKEIEMNKPTEKNETT